MLEFYQLLSYEFLKQKSSFTRPVPLLSPILAGGLTLLHLLFRYDYLKGLEANRDLSSWTLLIFQHHFLWMLLLPLTVTVLTSMIHYIEYSSNSWKNLLALSTACF
ncbi:MAG: ABC transporter permease subunit [Thermoanaerobacteraceae bacterium]|nr:ABC transporter permease subunit [Thermoanaerobacteraceae bacterium]